MRIKTNKPVQDNSILGIGAPALLDSSMEFKDMFRNGADNASTKTTDTRKRIEKDSYGDYDGWALGV